MTKRNIADIRIGGIDYSKYFTFPFVIQDTGTEQLDSAVVELRGLPTDDKFPPFTPVVLCGGRYSYVIADDTVTEVFGRSLWNHQLTLIDETKTLERILMEGKSFTQPLIKEVGEPKRAKAYKILNKEMLSREYDTNYKTPIKMQGDTILNILPASDLVSSEAITIQNLSSVEVTYSKAEVDIQGEFERVFFSDTLKINESAQIECTRPGVYTIRYILDIPSAGAIGKETVIVPISLYSESDIPPTYSIYDVMSITLETAEPIFKGEAPRYRILLTPEQETRFKSMDAPEMHFPNGRSLYENLKEIGDYIHALPKAKTDINGNRFVYWKELGSAERADLSKGAIYGASGFYNAADYASAVEANFANLINASDESEGSVTDPYSDGYITLRSNSYRIKEEDSYIPTNFPIGTKIKQVIVRIHDDNGMVQKEADITPAVFEKNEYDLLSGFSGAYPFSKTHALYYTTGQKNIEGLWYRPEDNPVDILNLLNNYAITNVINHFCGTNYTPENKLDFTKLSFQVTYIPIINGRARQERTESTVERVILAHNQSANQLSARAFGENLRGKVAMLGNSTDAKMYIFPYLDDIPKAGTMYDRKEFISLVTTRVFPDYCLSRIDFSTNYNNQGAFVQMKTGIRQYEIPAGQDRCTLLEEFCVIGKDEHVPRELGMLCQSVMCDMTLKAFYFTNLEARDITSAYINTLDDEGIGIAGSISLPAYSTSLGASVYFGFSFEDNFSAGKKSIDIGKDLARGTEYVEYGSRFYSKAKYLDFSFTRGYVPTNATPLDVANSLPIISGVADTIEGEAPYISTEDYTTGAFKPLIWNKDSADIGNVAYQLHFVSNDGYIIGSELARMMPYIRTHFNYDEAPRVYFYDAEIEELTGEANGNVVAESDLDVGWVQSYFLRIVEIPSQPYKSFVIKRPGGECIIGKNTDSADELIHFNFKRKR